MIWILTYDAAGKSAPAGEGGDWPLEVSRRKQLPPWVEMTNAQYKAYVATRSGADAEPEVGKTPLIKIVNKEPAWWDGAHWRRFDGKVVKR